MMSFTPTQNDIREIREAVYNTALHCINSEAAFMFNVRRARNSRFPPNVPVIEMDPFLDHAVAIPVSLLPEEIQNNIRPRYMISLEELFELRSYIGSSNLNNSNEIRNETQNNNSRNATVNTQINREIPTILKLFHRPILLFIILLAKSLYAHKIEILMFIILFFTFVNANSDLKHEIAKQRNQSWLLLLLILCYITACIFFIIYTFGLGNIFPYPRPLTIWDLMYCVTTIDLFLKFSTVVCKLLLTCLPMRLLTFQNRGKYYVMIEAASQLCRSLVPIQPWLYYLYYEAYEDPENAMGTLLSIMYIICKGIDVLPHIKFCHTAHRKLMQNMKLGVSPSKEQLIASGGKCAICHEEYSKPVRLRCKHIFCEICVSTWLNRERTCPLCRKRITDNPVYRDGHTTYSMQLY